MGQVGLVQVPAQRDDPRPFAWVAPARDGQPDLRRRTVEEPMPVRRRDTADRCVLTRPQPCGPNPGLVGEPMPAHEIDAGMQPAPRPLSCPTLHSRPRKAEFDGLTESDYAALPAQQVVEGHADRIDEWWPSARPFRETGRP
jgi:hypothetical protein